MAEPSGLSWLAVARQILDLLDPLLELLCRAGVLESPGEVHDMLLVRSHEHQCLLERHILEGRHREAHHVHRLGHLGLLAHGVHPGRLDELFLELLQRASSVLCGFHLVLLITLADFTRARTCRIPRSQARGCIPGSPRLLPHARLWLEYRGLATVAARQRVGDAAQQPLVLALLPVPLLLGLLGLFLHPPGLLLLGRLLLGFGLPLLGPALGLLFFVAGYGACGLFRLALRLIHRSSPPLNVRKAPYYWLAALVTSLTVMRPSAPVPSTWERSTPNSSAFCLAASVMFRSCPAASWA